MLFTNPFIIQDFNDVVIGGVHVDGDIDYMTYTAKVEQRIYKMVYAYVKENMSLGNSKKEAIEDAAALVDSYLTIDPSGEMILTERDVVKQILKSVEYQKWEAGIFDSFMDFHKGVITKSTPVEAGGLKPELQENYEMVDENDIHDLLDALIVKYNY